MFFICKKAATWIRNCLSQNSMAFSGSNYSPNGAAYFLGRRRRPYIVFSFRFLYGFMFLTRIYILMCTGLPFLKKWPASVTSSSAPDYVGCLCHHETDCTSCLVVLAVGWVKNLAIPRWVCPHPRSKSGLPLVGVSHLYQLPWWKKFAEVILSILPNSFPKPSLRHLSYMKVTKGCEVRFDGLVW